MIYDNGNQIDKLDIQALTAAKNETLLKEALRLAQSKAISMGSTIQEILETGEIEGLCKLQPEFSTLYLDVKIYNTSWIMSWPWSSLLCTTADDEADYILETIIRNLQMEEDGSWPNSK